MGLGYQTKVLCLREGKLCFLGNCGFLCEWFVCVRVCVFLLAGCAISSPSVGALVGLVGYNTTIYPVAMGKLSELLRNFLGVPEAM